MDSDYYSAVYTWFERCGIISNVRTHLRQKLVNALKSKDTTLNKHNIGPKSAKQYVYDLLVAEYLWNHNYTYTLSVFASEAPLLVNFCKHLPDASEDPGEKHKLQNDYVQHTLETLGIRPEEPVGLSIISEYAENDMPLLLCILKCTCLLPVNKKTDGTESNRPTYLQSSETQTETVYQSSSEIAKLTLARKKLFEQKETFSAQLREKENELKQQASIMEQQMAIINEKLAKAQNLMHTVHMKERQLNEEKKEADRRIYRKEIELSTREDALAREAERLQKERDSYRKFEGDLKKLQDELTKVKKDLPRRDIDKSLGFRDVQVQTDWDVFMADKYALDREKTELSTLVKVQQSRIEELTVRAVSLSRQLEEAQLLKRTPIEITAPVVRFSKTNTALSESSSTEDILQDARQRLRRLEEESLKADQCYFNCITTSPL